MARVRTFLALELTPKIRNRLTALQEALGSAVPDVKWVEPENLHVTLLFLGEVDDRDLPKACRAAQAAVAELPAFEMTVAGLRCFGSPRRPRTLWVGLGAGEAEVKAVHAALEAALLETGCYRREDRQFTPHVTLGRVKGGGPAEAFEAALKKHQRWSAGEGPVDEVLIMSSQLTPRGPSYAVMGRAPLG